MNNQNPLSIAPGPRPFAKYMATLSNMKLRELTMFGSPHLRQPAQFELNRRNYYEKVTFH